MFNPAELVLSCVIVFVDDKVFLMLKSLTDSCTRDCIIGV